MESVRYAATLESGEGFLAFAGGYLITPGPFMQVGEVELPEGRLLPDGHEVWPFPKVRRMEPTDGEYIYKVGAEGFPTDAKMITVLPAGYLVVTDHPVEGAWWGGKVLTYQFDRAAYIEVPV